jgi:hypothetical protein
MEETTRVEQAKFDLGAAEPAIDAGELPWAYGENRITAMVRDPDSAYLYWEITDEGIAAARAKLGPAGQHGWCNLRVYDTTGRDFDGTNANDYFDVRVDRNDREYYVMIRRPTSSMHVEIGIKSHEGYFHPIARSGRADFPRSAPSPNTTLDWMTVTSDPPPAAAPYRSRYIGPVPPLPGREAGGYVDVWRAGNVPSTADTGEPKKGQGPWSTSTHRTLERTAHVERWWRLDAWRSELRGGLRFLRWEHADPQRILVELLGDAPIHWQVEGGEMVAYGPWQVSIKGFEPEPGRRVLATWTMRWLRASTPMIERWEHLTERQVISEYEREHVIAGASEQQRLLERGASELWRVGGSERVWLGASEWMAMGASETLWTGASEMMGASALLYRGASERLGASEWLGASETWLGGSEKWQGASPTGGASEPAGGGNVGLSGERWVSRPEEK